MDELEKRQLPLSGSFQEFHGWFSFLLGLMEAEAGNVAQGLTYCESGLEHMTLARKHGLQSDPSLTAIASGSKRQLPDIAFRPEE